MKKKKDKTCYQAHLSDDVIMRMGESDHQEQGLDWNFYAYTNRSYWNFEMELTNDDVIRIHGLFTKILNVIEREIQK